MTCLCGTDEYFTHNIRKVFVHTYAASVAITKCEKQNVIQHCTLCACKITKRLVNVLFTQVIDYSKSNNYNYSTHVTSGTEV